VVRDLRSAARLALVLLAGAVGCSRGPADPVAALLGELEAAVEARDADRFALRLAPEFRGAHGLDRTQALAQLERYLAAYESVSLDVYGVEVERSEAAAEVRLVVELSGNARKVFGLEGLLPPSAVYRFALEAADEGGTWLVRAASWEPVEAAPAPTRDAPR
jgi:hypothetical protein